MHEAGLLNAAVAAVTAAAEGRPVLQITLAIGPGVEIAAAEQAWRQAAAGGVVEGATVTWRRAHDTLSCLACGHEYPGDRLTPCPLCGANGLVIAPAHEIEIVDWIAGQGRAGRHPSAEREPPGRA